jgi:hypothetical protein
LLENFLAKTTNESGFGYQNMSAVLITLKWFWVLKNVYRGIVSSLLRED